MLLCEYAKQGKQGAFRSATWKIPRYLFSTGTHVPHGRNQHQRGSQVGEMFFWGMQVTTATGLNCIMSESNINTEDILNLLIESKKLHTHP